MTLRNERRKACARLRIRAYGESMNDQTLAPVQPIRTAGRLFAVAALGSLLFGAVGCTSSQTTAPDTSQTAPSEASTGSDASGGAEASHSATSDHESDATANAGGDTTGAQVARDVVEQAPASSAAEALAAAQQAFTGEPTSIALDQRHDGTLEYDIGLVSSTEKYEVELDADTLAVLSEEREPLDPGDDDLQEVFDLTKVVDVTKAAVTARAAQTGVINEWSLEGDSDGSVVYDFDIVPKGATDDVEVRVNALTNELLPRS